MGRYLPKRPFRTRINRVNFCIDEVIAVWFNDVLSDAAPLFLRWKEFDYKVECEPILLRRLAPTILREMWTMSALGMN